MQGSNREEDVDEARIDALYELPPNEFVAARDRLAKELKDAGDRGAAEEVRRLRRPSIAAWALNQLVRKEPGEVERLLRASGDLREEQRVTLAGGGGRVQETIEERRRVLDRLISAAVDVLESTGRETTRSELTEIEGTLMAVATDDAVAETLRAGRFEKHVLPVSGFDELLALAVVPDEGRRQGEGGGRNARARDRHAGGRERRGHDLASENVAAAIERARRQHDRVAKRADAAGGEAMRLRREADNAAEEAKRLSGEAAEASRRADRLRAQAARADRAAGRAQGAADRAEQRSRKLRAEAEEAQRALEDLVARDRHPFQPS